MPLYKTGYGSPVDQVDTSDLYDRGELREEIDDTGRHKIWRYVYNGSGGAFAAGDVLAYAAGDTTQGNARKAPADAPRASILGVAQHAIANESYGWVLVLGYGTVKADTGTGVTANTSVVVDPTDAGTVTSAANLAGAVKYDVEIGFAPAAIAASASGSIYIRCPL